MAYIMTKYDFVSIGEVFLCFEVFKVITTL